MYGSKELLCVECRQKLTDEIYMSLPLVLEAVYCSKARTLKRAVNAYNLRRLRLVKCYVHAYGRTHSRSALKIIKTIFFCSCVHIVHLFAKGLNHTRITNITKCRPQNKRSWTTLLSISTPTKAIVAHCRVERRKANNKKGGSFDKQI